MTADRIEKIMKEADYKECWNCGTLNNMAVNKGTCSVCGRGIEYELVILRSHGCYHQYI